MPCTKAVPNSARLVPVTAGNTYYEEMALLPLVIHPDENFEEVEPLHAKLTHPLDVKIVEDTDDRAPEGWVQTVLVQEFDEFEEE